MYSPVHPIYIYLKCIEPVSVMPNVFFNSLFDIVNSKSSYTMQYVVLFPLVKVYDIYLFLGSDPEEMRRAQEDMRAQGVPSLSSLLPRSN